MIHKFFGLSFAADDMGGGNSANTNPDMATRASVFLRLKATDPQPRELAWQEFYERYAPVITAYARRHGVNAHQAEEIVQDVMLGFFSASPRFVYDPSRGHFRAYLRTCVGRALKRLRDSERTHRTGSVPLDEVDVPDTRGDDPADLRLWDEMWQRQQLHRILDEVREQYRRRGRIETFLAFERSVLFGQPPEKIARELGISVASVNMAKMRVTRRLAEKKARLAEEDW